MILEETIKKASIVLKRGLINSHALDAQLILSNIMGVSKEFILLNPDIKISEKTRKKYYEHINRRLKKEPVAYITGKKEFWSQDFLLNRSTLIPRPETELIIYKVIKLFKNKKINILDIGVGSGCILLSILKELKYAKGIGIDIAPKAIKKSMENSKRLSLANRSKFKVFDIEKFNHGKYDLIVSNPPYVPLKDIKNLSKDILNYEPLIALKGGFDGLDLIKKVIYKSKYLLKRNGLLIVEIGHKQYIEVSDIFKKHGFRLIDKVYDNNRNVRCIIITNA